MNDSVKTTSLGGVGLQEPARIGAEGGAVLRMMRMDSPCIPYFWTRQRP